MPQKNKDENNSTKRIVREVEELRKRNVELEFYKKEYKRLKEAEQERTERYGIIFEEVAVSIVVVDKEGRIVDVNSHHIINIGKGKTNKDDYLGKSILTHSSVVNAGLVEQYKGVLEGEILHKTDVYFPSTTGGTDAYFNVRGKPILKDGKIIGAVFTHEDVTKRKQAEDELKAHGYQLEKLIEERTTRLQQEIDERKQVEEDLQASVLELRIRNEILEIFHTTPDEQVYGELLKLFLEVFKSKYGTFGYFDQEGSFVIPSMTRDIYWQKCRVPDKEIIFKKATFSGIWARAIKEKKTLYLNDGPFSIPEGHIPIKNTMVSPIIFRDQVISAIHLANKETDYDEGDRGLLETIADYVAPVLNARLERDRLERERRRTEQAVLRSEERLAHAQGIAHVGCWEIDLNLQVGWWSDELYRIFGVDPGDVTVSRESVGKLIPPGDLAVMNAAYEAA
ncbi:MAG: PAS domain S-box protein, partial [Candidatus Aminicenantes bacterium]|nr:PAS domain S-box protein [Candidatus Aminicenantes bacterium]NIM79252.1 PAS domain S-box protein [Candidatus Aminicenantes bacterium]NIN18538.1 PAS domain S-box protein [Candidatus Aminicenantes bacterium]NIN42435.1 PAS domain S-box protein [Candidatus Aminicenantes bacterium]NIN85193.1 PAS domain S-box protein [Candidatus Aminicenantes bacterium]